MENALAWILSRSKERSTWLGLIGFAATVGWALSPGQQEAIVNAAVAIASLVAVLTTDNS